MKPEDHTTAQILLHLEDIEVSLERLNELLEASQDYRDLVALFGAGYENPAQLLAAQPDAIRVMNKLMRPYFHIYYQWKACPLGRIGCVPVLLPPETLASA